MEKELGFAALKKLVFYLVHTVPYVKEQNCGWMWVKMDHLS